ncbi:LOW QUALITY PROTEIN: Protein of unknown function [Gryllus bimaculatus]|nr:LOW QUALITY PROTEIN: Protein of unknown function [Gryllus bimaculatus]
MAGAPRRRRRGGDSGSDEGAATIEGRRARAVRKGGAGRPSAQRRESAALSHLPSAAPASAAAAAPSRAGAPGRARAVPPAGFASRSSVAAARSRLVNRAADPGASRAPARLRPPPPPPPPPPTSASTPLPVAGLHGLGSTTSTWCLLACDCRFAHLANSPWCLKSSRVSRTLQLRTAEMKPRATEVGGRGAATATLQSQPVVPAAAAAAKYLAEGRAGEQAPHAQPQRARGRRLPPLPPVIGKEMQTNELGSKHRNEDVTIEVAVGRAKEVLGGKGAAGIN